MKLLFLAIIQVLLAFPVRQDFGFDSYGRLGSVSSGGCSATYAYLPNSDLLQSTTFRSGGNPVLTATRTWDYVVATFKGRSATQNTIQDTYVWGQDLSGTMTGAGGIGGLLMVTTTNGQSFVCHDGNGNVRALVSAADKTIVARYEYGPFGQPLRTTGPQAKANPFRFSSKFTDEESGLVYYGYRYYSPNLGRWIGRDPSEEDGGNNLFGFVLNSPVNGIDNYGEKPGLFAKMFVSILIWLGSADKGVLPPKTPLSEGAREAIEYYENVDKRNNFKARNRFTGGAAGIGIALGLVELETTARAGIAAANVIAGGGRSTDPAQANLEDFFRDRGTGGKEGGWDDLDAAIAALEIGGYEADAAAVSWGTIQTLGDAYDAYTQP